MRRARLCCTTLTRTWNTQPIQGQQLQQPIQGHKITTTHSGSIITTTHSRSTITTINSRLTITTHSRSTITTTHSMSTITTTHSGSTNFNNPFRVNNYNSFRVKTLYHPDLSSSWGQPLQSSKCDMILTHAVTYVCQCNVNTSHGSISNKSQNS